MNFSIDLMEGIVSNSQGAVTMTDGGYVLATRRDDISALLDDLETGYQGQIGADLVRDKALLQASYPYLASEFENLIHIRRGGEVDSNSMARWMLEQAKLAGLIQLRGECHEIKSGKAFEMTVDSKVTVADVFINAAGPFINAVASQLGYQLPTRNVLQQKLAFEDRAGAVDRSNPFTIDLDPQEVAWTEEEAAFLMTEGRVELTHQLRGGIHCRPEGRRSGSWVKLGWAYNQTPSAPARDPVLDDLFPEVVMRGAARAQSALSVYLDNMPRRLHHYGGYYTMTEENWPIIDQAGPEGSFVAGAMSGFGTMAACGAGSIMANMVTGHSTPDYTTLLGFERYGDANLMKTLKQIADRSLL